MKVQLIQLDPRAPVPEYKSQGAGAFDLTIQSVGGSRLLYEQEFVLPPQAQVMIGTGIQMYIGDPEYAAVLLPRSGLGSKGLVLGNLVGLCDSDYQGEYLMCAWNRTDEPITLVQGMRVVQCAIIRVARVEFDVVKSFSTRTEREAGGFGSTGLR